MKKVKIFWFAFIISFIIVSCMLLVEKLSLLPKSIFLLIFLTATLGLILYHQEEENEE